MSNFSDDSHTRFWAIVTVSAGTPSLASSFNVGSVTDTGVGLLTVNISLAFTSANWCCQVSVERPNTTMTVANLMYPAIRNAGLASNSVLVECWDGTPVTANLVDPKSWHVSGNGVQ